VRRRVFANHEGRLASTDEGFEDAAATFLEARLVSVTDAPLTSPEFAGRCAPSVYGRRRRAVTA
jgi:hypothetical protein